MTTSVTTDTSGLVEVIDLNPGPIAFVELQQGPKGETGSSGPGTAMELPFSWGDAFPVVVSQMMAGETIYKVEVIVKTPFDTPSSLSLGDALDNESLVPVACTDLTAACTYQYTPGVYFSTGKQINAYLTLGGGNATGDGLILFYK
jgi:hypothetical protein